MNTAPAATAVPPVSLAEKAAMLGAAFLVGILLTTPAARGLGVNVVTATAHFIADTAANTVHALGSLVGLA